MAEYHFLGQKITCGNANSDLWYSRYMGTTNYRGIGYVDIAPTLFDGIQCVIDNKGFFPPASATTEQKTCVFVDENNIERFKIFVDYTDSERFHLVYYVYNENLDVYDTMAHHYEDGYWARNTNLTDPETRWREGLFLAYFGNTTGVSMNEDYSNEFGFVLQHDQGYYDGEGWGDFLYTGTPDTCTVEFNEHGNAQSYYEPCWEFVSGYYSKESSGGHQNAFFGHHVTQVVQYLMTYVEPYDPSEDPEDTTYGEEDTPPEFYDPLDNEGGYNSPFDHVPLKSAVSSGMIQCYLPTDTELRSFNNYLWSDNYATSLQKWGLKPTDNIISFGVTPFDLTSKRSSITQEVKMCGVGTGVQMSFMTGLTTYFDFPCGEIFVQGWTGTYLDYTHTKYYMFIPCVGIVELRACDIVNKYVKLEYRGDAATGDLIAYVITRRQGEEGKEQRLYEFTGNCLYQLPLSSADFATYYQQKRHSITNVISAIGSGLGGMIAGASMGGVAGAVAGGLVGGINSINSVWDSIESYTSAAPDVSRSGNISGAMPMLQKWQPYIVYVRQKEYRGKGHFNYFSAPVMREMKLSDCKGFTQVSKIRLDFSATTEEKEIITALLKDGIFINK